MSTTHLYTTESRHHGSIPEDLELQAQHLEHLAATSHLAISSAQAYSLVKFLELVLRKNEAVNLTAIREWDKALVLHLIDSLMLLEAFDASEAVQSEGGFLDMGCGAGFPGIPLAIMRRNRRGTLCDSVKKKIGAVCEFLEALNLTSQLTTTSERLEILGKHEAQHYSCVVSRALASPVVVLEYATPLLVPHGHCIIALGAPTQEDMARCEAAAEICGLRLYSQKHTELPEQAGRRCILVYEKVSHPRITLPRSLGKARKEPLA